MSESFPWDRRDILVFYALPDDEQDPVAGTPSLVLEGWERIDPENKILLSDGAPYLSVLDVEDLLDTIEKRRVSLLQGEFVGNDTDRMTRALEKLDSLAEWIRDTGLPWFAYQLEPPEMAGDGTARAKGLAAGG